MIYKDSCKIKTFKPYERLLTYIFIKLIIISFKFNSIHHIKHLIEVNIKYNSWKKELKFIKIKISAYKLLILI